MIGALINWGLLILVILVIFGIPALLCRPATFLAP